MEKVNEEEIVNGKKIITITEKAEVKVSEVQVELIENNNKYNVEGSMEEKPTKPATTKIRKSSVRRKKKRRKHDKSIHGVKNDEKFTSAFVPTSPSTRVEIGVDESNYVITTATASSPAALANNCKYF